MGRGDGGDIERVGDVEGDLQGAVAVFGAGGVLGGAVGVDEGAAAVDLTGQVGQGCLGAMLRSVCPQDVGFDDHLVDAVAPDGIVEFLSAALGVGGAGEDVVPGVFWTGVGVDMAGLVEQVLLEGSPVGGSGVRGVQSLLGGGAAADGEGAEARELGGGAATFAVGSAEFVADVAELLGDRGGLADRFGAGVQVGVPA